MSVEEQFKRINAKVSELLKRLEALQKENQRLKAELLPAREREVQLMERVREMEEKIMVLKAASGKMDEAEKKELDKKLHSYLKEIDRCINMLSSE